MERTLQFNNKPYQNQSIAKKSFSLNELIFSSIILFGFLTLFFTIFYNELIVRILSYCYFVAGYIFYFYNFFNSKTKNPIKYFSLVFFLFLFFIWLLTGLEYQSLISCLSFFLIFSSFDFAEEISISKSMLKIVYFFFFLQGVLLIITSFTSYAYMSKVGGTIVMSDLLLGLSNPNETGIALAETIMILFICCQTNKHKFFKFITIAVIAYLLYLLVLTRARTSFLGVLLYFVFSFFNRKKKGIIIRKKWLMLIFIIYALVFSFVYLYFFNNFDNMTSLFGKTLFSGRQRVYLNHIELWTNKLIGNLNVFYLDNAHNGFLSILVNFGIVGLVLYLIHLFFSLNNIRVNFCQNTISRMGFIAILCIYLMCSTEASFITGGHYYYSNFLILCWLASYKVKGYSYEKNRIY